jgi:hypothetical protein
MAAGLGFKDFTTGEVLTAADVDGYLMQNIWVFASAAARDAAVTSPQEGNFAYLKDTNTTTYYTGSAWTNLDTTGMVNPMTTTGDTIYSSSGSTPARLGIGTAGQVLTVNAGATAPEWKTPAGGGGKVLQVVQGTLTGTAQTTSTTMASSGLTVSITPSSASSKVLILASISGVAKTGGNVNTAVKLELVRGATKIMDLSDVNAYNNTTDLQDIGSVAANCLDTPATTSATSYTINFASYQSGQTVYINNYRASDTTRSSIIAMEIGA